MEIVRKNKSDKLSHMFLLLQNGSPTHPSSNEGLATPYKVRLVFLALRVDTHNIESYTPTRHRSACISMSYCCIVNTAVVSSV
jgi:hypothetical protein